MSWSVNARGTIDYVKTELIRQFEYPLAESPRGLLDDGEKDTVRRVKETIFQCLDTFDQGSEVDVSAYGHATQHAANPKRIARQQVTLKIE